MLIYINAKWDFSNRINSIQSVNPETNSLCTCLFSLFALCTFNWECPIIILWCCTFVLFHIISQHFIHNTRVGRFHLVCSLWKFLNIGRQSFSRSFVLLTECACLVFLCTMAWYKIMLQSYWLRKINVVNYLIIAQTMHFVLELFCQLHWVDSECHGKYLTVSNILRFYTS